MRQKKQLHNNMPTQSLFTSMTGLPLFGTNTTARRCTDHLRPLPPYRRHGTARHGMAQAVYAPPPPSCTARQHKKKDHNILCSVWHCPLSLNPKGSGPGV